MILEVVKIVVKFVEVIIAVNLALVKFAVMSFVVVRIAVNIAVVKTALMVLAVCCFLFCGGC